jgi:glycerol-3-phosphate cytidylyltransferase
MSNFDDGYIVGFTCSAFDLLHPGHVAMLRECKEHCDYLIVGLHVDPTIERVKAKQKPVQTVYERYVQLSGCKYINEVIPYETESDLINLLATQPINIRFVGEEYKDTFTTGQDICDQRGIKLFYNERKHTWSSTDLRGRL